MTFEDRVTALAPFGFTPRQTRFLVTVALHGGYCLRRQYLAFAGLRYGKNVRDFLDGLVSQQIAQRFTYQANRGHVYHLHTTSLYRALEQRDNRNRRHVSPAAIARKLMLLDFVLTMPDAEWYATEADKVGLFTRDLGIPIGDLPSRVYAPKDRQRGATTRQFVHKLPVYRTGDRGVIHFVYLVNDATGHGLEQFLHDHVRLLSALRAWAVVAVCPRELNGLSACRTAFSRFVSTTWRPAAGACMPDARWFFATRRCVESGDLRSLSVADLNRFREARGDFASAHMEALYGAWLTHGDRALSHADAPAPVMRPPVAQFLERELPSTYSQFGSFAGVS